MSQTSAAEQAFQHVRSRILDDRLPGGTMITEGEVAAELGISRTPVREAFLRLEVEGWMRLYPRRGALVVPVGPHEPAELVEARVLLEHHAAQQLVVHGLHAEAAAALREVVAAQEDALDAGDTDSYADLDAAFHAELVGRAGNSLLVGFFTTLRERQHRLLVRAVHRADDVRRLVREHAQLADLLEQGDPEGLATALRSHLETAHLTPAGGAR